MPATATAPYSSCTRAFVMRPGYTLVEMLVTVTITSLILTSVGVTLSKLFRAEGQLRMGAAQQAVVGRLTLQLRGDAHQAAAVDPLPGNEAEPGFVLKLPDDSAVEYRLTSRGVRRTVRRGDQRQHHELFRLVPGEQTRYEIRSEANATFVTLQIDHPLPPAGSIPPDPASGAGPAQRSVRIEAAVGLNRFLSGGGS